MTRGLAGRLARRTRRRLAVLRGDKASIDEHSEPLIGLERRHHPKAAATLSHCLNQRLAVVEVMPGCGNLPVLRAGGIYCRPLGGRRRPPRRGMDTLIVPERSVHPSRRDARSARRRAMSAAATPSAASRPSTTSIWGEIGLLMRSSAPFHGSWLISCVRASCWR